MKSSTPSFGIGGTLFLIFMVLKLTGHINWSWWWVTAPMWIPLGLAALIAGIALAFCGLSYFRR